MMTTERMRPKMIASQTLRTESRTITRLVVEERQLHVRRQLALRGPGVRCCRRVGDVERAAVGLAADVQQHRVDALGRDDVEDRLRPALDAGEVADAYRVPVDDGDDRLAMSSMVCTRPSTTAR